MTVLQASGEVKTTVIGIDFSTIAAKTGMARALVDIVSMSAELCDVRTASKRTPPLEIAARWIGNRADDTRVLIAIDAPLGWPDAMRDDEFVHHVAGQRVNVSANMLFLRETDRRIEQRFKRKPLAVGADKIARTAHAALGFLGDLRYKLRPETLPLAQSPTDVEKLALSVIEVYPAATLRAHAIDTGNYKKRGNAGMHDRKRIIEGLPKLELRNHVDLDKVARNDDTVDAAVCVLAGLDFLAGNSEGPGDRLQQHSDREGWIWTKA